MGQARRCADAAAEHPLPHHPGGVIDCLIPRCGHEGKGAAKHHIALASRIRLN